MGSKSKLAERQQRSQRIRGAVVSGVLGLTLLLGWDALRNYRMVHGSDGAGCKRDNEGSWAIGFFKGPSPLSLLPIEDQPQPVNSVVSNPVITCANTGPGSNYASQPFLHVSDEGRRLHVFFTRGAHGNNDIGVSESVDGGVTWHYLGVALHEEGWSVSHPFIFTWNGAVYMMPQGEGSGALRVYKSVEFPLRWEAETVLVNRPLKSAVLAQHDGRWWMFANTKDDELVAYYADSPLGPWLPHTRNPLSGKAPIGVDGAGGLVEWEGKLYRFGQNHAMGHSYSLAGFEVKALDQTSFFQSQTTVSFGRRMPWNKERMHHVDVQKLPDGTYIAMVDGDSKEYTALQDMVAHRVMQLACLWLFIAGLSVVLYKHRQAGGMVFSGEGYKYTDSMKHYH